MHGTFRKSGLLLLAACLLGVCVAAADESSARVAFVALPICPEGATPLECTPVITVLDTETGNSVDYHVPANGVVQPEKLLWTSDGRALTMLFSTGLVSNIAVLELDTLVFNTLTSLTPGAISDFTLSPDGSTVAYVIVTPEQNFPHRLTLLDMETREMRVPVGNLEVRQPAYAPDGRSIAALRVERQWDIILIDTEDGALTDLTPENPSGFSPHWSPDGTQITYAMIDADGNYIVTVDANGNNLNILATGDLLTRPQWALGGTAVLYGVNNRETYETRLVLHDLASGQETDVPVTRLLGFYNVSPDGTQLAYVGYEQRSVMLCVHDLTTFQDTCYPETRPDQNTTPAWG
jgi:dipeptidyl aminopeptidase/acylaminoacyl peptidase